MSTTQVSDPYEAITRRLDQYQESINKQRDLIQQLRMLGQQTMSGIPAMGTAQPVAEPVRRRNGQKPAAATAKKPGPKTGGRRSSGNEKPLIQVCWDLVSGNSGLTSGEVTKKIHEGKLFKSKSDNLGNMVQTQLYKLRDTYKVIKRDEATKQWASVENAVYPLPNEPTAE